MRERSRNTLRLGVALVIGVVCIVGLTGLFIADVGSTTPPPAEFDDTVPVGLTLEDERGLDDAVSLPQAQVFYSQYQYVVGYYGVETFVDERQQAGHEQQFGHPLTVYVSDYSDTALELSAEGYPIPEQSPGWTDAETAWFVVDSDAQTPAGDTVVPFSEREDAETFAGDHGGSVYDWESVLEQSFDRDDATVARDRVDDHHQVADDRIEAVDSAADRPPSIVAGEETETIQEAIDQAPANTTVVVPEGTYEETLEIDRPITLAGEGEVTIRGDDNSTVITVTGDGVGIQNLAITGVGNQTQGGEDLPVDVDEDEWDATFTTYYAGTDAGIGAYGADNLHVSDIDVETPASGVIGYDSTDAVVRNVSVTGPDDPTDGLAGILLFQSPSVVESSSVQGGTNGIYLYRSPETVLRSNEADGNEIGVHLMHTSDTLIDGNELRSHPGAGIYVMTGPERNAIVDNDIRASETAISVGGSETYVASNVVTDNGLGLRVESTTSFYDGNVLAGNTVGADVTAMLPTNRVIENDFVENDEHATATSGPLRIWNDGDSGNYWQGGAAIAGDATGTHADRSYTPTDAVDSQLHRTDGTQTLVRAPSLQALAGLEGSVPGMRTGSIVDQTPTCEPNNPERLDRTDWAEAAWPCADATISTND
ncbi:ABC-type transport system periplasmic substrate-binding protein (probable substrate copper) [Natrialba magadii ATCC 43099]|uniref:ABC-type transport system periplasmic substrate-binding protein (Probable substrate copper) n=1 Tax=Natrialba magadii (strain ATCC 43099 / DSM 3394 / CCM 3739 / CIP 104546 / IAM 13178 / JCM 8861 / NBRC 102185 / NCIMB 2190 / MS3) TaxID=547559 RepID=D3SZ43_NATMM|nr:NosD domain-containing protein [Natrialba magadii]ADD06235.1 ABC-type transport system periplasmic substrate-binding protein (probable substrate copper) [Natrialba magadii ATCC 43099]ELY31050.1 NosL family protein [Natrialba magadii ATCC 43099]